MQDDLFGAPPAPPNSRSKPRAAMPDPADDDGPVPAQPRRSTEVLPLPPDDATRALAARLNPRIRLGAST